MKNRGMKKRSQLIAALLFSHLLTLAAPTPAQDPDLFEKKVRPLFAAKCYACHGPKMQMGGLNLSQSAAAVVKPGDPAQSRLYQALTYEGAIKMPPTGKLPPEDLAVVKNWIAAGAAWPNATLASAPPKALDRSHWAFQPVRDSAPPRVKNEAWIKSPIDRFILAKLEDKGLAPAPPATKLALLRRTAYDLTGLPPTPEQIAAFLKDTSPAAYAHLVDRLLATPQYGERWGRLWLDVARYADSTGMDEDHIYPHGWRYRDYVVQAFNQDIPYNRFMQEQIAGDLLPANNPADHIRGIVATGFLALGPKPLAQQDRVQMIYDVVDEQIDTTSKAFLGLTVACARCHDHKFDPILTKDYYSLASIFASTTAFRDLGSPGSVSHLYYAPLDPVAYDRYQAQRWRMLAKQIELENALNEDHTREYALLRPKLAELMTSSPQWAKWLEAADAKAQSTYLKKWFDAAPAARPDMARQYREQYEEAAKKWDAELASWRKRLAVEVAQDRDIPGRPKPDAEAEPFFTAVTFNGGPMELADSERVAQLRREFDILQKGLGKEPDLASAVTDGPAISQQVFVRGDHHSRGEPVAKVFPVVLAGDSQEAPKQGSGRLELARWLASETNPMPARVFVNRVWQGHFGEALVRTPNNWGKTGDVPVHGELLDYLAKRFVENGWSIKALHRAILLSNTYQMSGEASPAAKEADPANRLCSRFNRLRMSVEQIRDSLLALDGSLDSTLGGAHAKATPDDSKRRTLYLPVRRGSVPVMLSTFDFGDATTPGEGRPRTNVAPQALFMMNAAFTGERALGFAKRLLDDAALTDAQRIDRAYLMAFARNPDPVEVDESLSYIAALEKRLGTPEAHVTAWRSFCRILFSTNEFIYLP